jgi:hypothetical protein
VNLIRSVSNNKLKPPVYVKLVTTRQRLQHYLSNGLAITAESSIEQSLEVIVLVNDVSRSDIGPKNASSEKFGFVFILLHSLCTMTTCTTFLSQQNLKVNTPIL